MVVCCNVFHKEYGDLNLLGIPANAYSAMEVGILYINHKIKCFAENRTKCVMSQNCVRRGNVVTIMARSSATGNVVPRFILSREVCFSMNI